jgi:hypothetical protein
VERIEVSTEQVRVTLREVVAERPNFVYVAHSMDNERNMCYYVHPGIDGAPDTCGCLIGHVLNRLGVPMDELKQHEGKDAFRVVRTLLDTSSKARKALTEAQNVQDRGWPWADALRAAEEELAA